MTLHRTYLLSNISAGLFIDLVVPSDGEVMSAAQAHLQELQLPSTVQQGFFISLYPVDPGADVAMAPEVSPAADQQSTAELSPLDAAAAQGPMDWNDEASSAADPSGSSDRRTSPADELPVIAFPLGGAGGH